MLEIARIKGKGTIRKNEKSVSINSELEIDLTGQVFADSIDTHIYSDVEVQIEFICGAMF
jgi:acyl-CoA hydrolase